MTQYTENRIKKLCKGKISCLRHAQFKEQQLNKSLKKVWTYTNRLQEQYLFGLYRDKADGTIVTLGCYIPCISNFFPVY